jgi:hypothetical protein
MPAKLERTTSLPSTPKAAAVARSAPVAAPTPVEKAQAPAAPTAVFTADEPKRAELATGQRYLAKSAAPDALWGEVSNEVSAGADDFDPKQFAALSPAQQQDQLQALRTQRNELKSQIEARLQQLDVKWDRSRVSTRSEALREYQEASRNLDPATRHELDGLLNRAERAQRTINHLRVETDKLGHKGPRHTAERDRLAAELRRARADQSKAVAAATTLVDDQGLKADRLAVTEQVIDPNAPAPGSGQTLLEKFATFFHLDFLIGVVEQVVGSLRKADDQRQAERNREQQEDTVRAQRLAQDLAKRLEQARRVEEDAGAQADRMRAFAARR